MPNRVAAVTGASSGLGALFARKLAARGYDLLLIARRQDRLEQLAREIQEARQVTVEPFAADLSTLEGIERVAARLEAEPRLAMLVNNAGFGTNGRFFEAPFEEQARMHRVHIDAILRLTRAALPGMVERDEGAVINVSSVAAFARAPGAVSYGATKAWISAFTEGIHLELKTKGSKVVAQALCPGFTYTEFHDVIGFDRARISRSFWLQAEDVVNASLEAVQDGRLFVIPGWRYRLFVAVWTKLPAALRLALEARSPHRKDEARAV